VKGQQAYFDRFFQRETVDLPVDIDRARFVGSHIPGSVRTILDIGCGSGVVTRQVRDESRVCGLDFSFAGLRRLSASGIRCVQGSIDALPFADASFDLTMANEVLEHLDDRALAAAIRELGRVAAQYVLLTLPNRDNLAFLRQECPRCKTVSVPWGHLQAFTRATLPLIPGFVCSKTFLFGPRIPDGCSPLTRLLHWPRLLYYPLQPGMTCPICGHQAGSDANRSLLGFMRRAIEAAGRIVSPKSPRWILTLYDRQTAS